MSDTSPDSGFFQPLDPQEFGVDPSQVKIDTTVAHPARVYDFLLGGKDNYAADRVVAEQGLGLIPDAGQAARCNREFIHRAVRYLVGEVGITQIIDVGTGIPTSPAVHEIARQVDPAVQVAYVDNDPVVLAHDRALLATEPGVVTFAGDLREPASVLDQSAVGELIDFTRPVAVLFAAVFHFVTDDQDPAGIIAAYRRRMAPGSAVVISHDTSTGRDPALVRQAEELYDNASAPLVMRTREQITALFDGFHICEPGVVNLHQWRPAPGEITPTTGGEWMHAGVGLLDRTPP